MRNLQAALRHIRLFLLDLDGTTTIEDELLPGTKELIRTLIRQKKDYVFLTNNCSKRAADYVAKLKGLGIAATIENVFTAGQATAQYINSTMKGARIFLLGTRALRREMAEAGIRILDSPDREYDYVVVSFDKELTYRRLEIACQLIDRGVPFLATHPDLVCPLKNKRFIPDCGSICQMIENATGRKPKYFGKPDKVMVKLIARQKQVPLRAIAMAGDRLYTDIALGKNAGIFTMCVLTGESSRKDIRRSPLKPDAVLHSIAELAGCLRDISDVE